MPLLIIHNPISGRKKLFNPGAVIKKILDYKKVPYNWFETLPQDKQPFHQLDFKKYQRIIVIGGDGTLREVVSFLISNNFRIPIGIVPAGSANLLAFSLKLPLFPITKVLNIALNATTKSFDVGVVNEHEYFLIGCGKGHDAMMMKAANRSFKRHFGFLAYLFAITRQIFHFRRIKYHLIVDDVHYRFKARTVLVFNMLNVFGFFKNYRIDPHDGQLNVVILQASTFWALGKVLLKLVQGLAHHKKSGLKFLTGKNITIRTKQRDIPVEIDGDIFHFEKITVRVIKDAILIATK